MPKIEIKGVGIMQRRVETFNAEDDPEAVMRAFACLKGPEQTWADNEAWCLDVLRRAGVEGLAEKAPDFALRFPEDTAQWLARAWLRAYRRMKRLRKSGGDVVAMLDAAEEMGRLKERIWWRRGVDPETRARREALALQARNSRLALAVPSWAEANAMRREEAEAWRTVAREVAASAPFGGARLEARINAELQRRGLETRSGPAIRKATKGIRR